GPHVRRGVRPATGRVRGVLLRSARAHDADLPDAGDRLGAHDVGAADGAARALRRALGARGRPQGGGSRTLCRGARRGGGGTVSSRPRGATVPVRRGSRHDARELLERGVAWAGLPGDALAYVLADVAATGRW